MVRTTSCTVPCYRGAEGVLLKVRRCATHTELTGCDTFMMCSRFLQALHKSSLSFLDSILHQHNLSLQHTSVFNTRKSEGEEERKEKKTKQNSPDWHSGILSLNSPWCGGVDGLTINLQPGANTSETLLKHGRDHAI